MRACVRVVFVLFATADRIWLERYTRPSEYDRYSDLEQRYLDVCVISGTSRTALVCVCVLCVVAIYLLSDRREMCAVFVISVRVLFAVRSGHIKCVVTVCGKAIADEIRRRQMCSVFVKVRLGAIQAYHIRDQCWFKTILNVEKGTQVCV